MSKHNPGPWRVDTGDDLQVIGRPDRPCTRYGAEGEWDVATITDLHEDNKSEMISNADLIAAAPEMLIALKDMLALVDAANSNEPIDAVMAKMPLSRVLAVHNAMRSAIAKAEGRSTE